jgi:molecular chaperone GrpE
VLDSCDAALAHGATEVEPVLAALYGALAKEGLERIDPKGAPFDPAEAEAVMHEPGEGGDQVVAEVLRPGYRWRGKVLRPAMVKVAD